MFIFPYYIWECFSLKVYYEKLQVLNLNLVQLKNSSGLAFTLHQKIETIDDYIKIKIIQHEIFKEFTHDL